MNPKRRPEDQSDTVASTRATNINNFIFSLIYQASFDVGIIPQDWKTANVIPIFKKGSKSDAANYRPVSLTSVPCKIMESLIKTSMTSFLDENKIITDSQHGFMKQRSCLTNLLGMF